MMALWNACLGTEFWRTVQVLSSVVLLVLTAVWQHSSALRHSSNARASAGSSSNTWSPSKASCPEAAMQTPGKRSRLLTVWAVKDFRINLDEEELRTRSRDEFQRSASSSSSFTWYFECNVVEILMILHGLV